MNTPIVRPKRPIDFSVHGLVYCTMMMFMGLAAQSSQSNLLVAVFGLMLGLVFVSLFFCWIVLRGLSVRRNLPEHGVVGKPMVIEYVLENRKRFWSSLSVTAGELDGLAAFGRQPPAYLLHLPPRQKTEISAEAIARRRGVHQFDRLQITSAFPFGFIRRAAVVRSADAVLVYPAIGKVDQRLIQMCRAAENSGSRMRPQRGGNDEFYGVKEYQSGENPRHIYWRRSARTGTLVTREMSHVSPPRILILLDTFLADQRLEAQANVERAIAMAASLAQAALEQGMPVGLIAWDGHWVDVPPNRGKRHGRELLAAMARLGTNRAQEQSLLIEQGFHRRDPGISQVLISPSPMQQSLADSARGSLVAVSAAPQSASQKWFEFEPLVDFETCMPVETR